ncbi:unnamed protein product [Discosporangium mesarthrocarpum]
MTVYYPSGWAPVPTDRERAFHDLVGKGMVVGAALTLLLCLRMAIPYGRYSTQRIGGIRFPLLNAKVGWIFMESPNLLMAAWCLWRSDIGCRSSLANLALLSMFVGHYINRTLIFPLRMRGGKQMPLAVALAAWIFCHVNSYLQCAHLLLFRVYPKAWLCDPRFILGAILFLTGFGINYHSDVILMRLRGHGEAGYKIPRGGLFEYVSGANFFGECLEWIGYAMAGWSLAGSAFALYTVCNIGPRAVRHHQWYIDKFKETYPRSRKAFIPFIW